MKLLLGALFIFGSASSPALAGTPMEESVVGRWGYIMKIFKGQEMPEPPDATLRLRYEFSAEGKSRLHWWRIGENLHCERTGSYSVQGDFIVDQTEWVSPENTIDCAKDPDMEPGKLTKIPFTITEGNLHTRIQLGENEIFYVWKKLNEGEEL